MRRVTLGFKTAFLVTSASLFISSSHAEKPPAPAAQLEAIKRDSAEARKAFDEVHATNSSDEQKKKAGEKLNSDRSVCARRAFELASKNLEDPVALEALTWIIAGDENRPNGYAQAADDVLEKTFDLLTCRFATSDRIGPACGAASRYFLNHVTQPERFLRAVLEKNPHREMRARACFGLVRYFRRLERQAQLMLEPAYRRDFEESYSPERVQRFVKLDLDRLGKDAEAFLEETIAKYGDLKPWGKVTLGEQAKGMLFQRRNLAIGKPIPDIDGEGIDGQRMKLSDFRGKVVVLTFWATWCGPCMAMVPDERALVERMKGKPFVLLGINCDADRRKAKSEMDKNGVTWRSWWDDEEGPIATGWGVFSWPTIYVIDHRGIIRFKNVRGEKLDAVVNQLVAEAEKKS